MMTLRSAGEHSGYEGDTKAGTLISKQVREARSFVVFVFRQERIGERAHWNEERRDAQSLQSASHREVAIVGAEIEAREAPHGHRKNAVADSDERPDTDFGQNSDYDRG